jgi:hypothetical protein
MRVRFRRSLLRATHFSTEETEGTEETQGKVIHRFQQRGSLGPSHGAELPRYVNAFSRTRLPVLPADGQKPIANRGIPRLATRFLVPARRPRYDRNSKINTAGGSSDKSGEE